MRMFVCQLMHSGCSQILFTVWLAFSTAHLRELRSVCVHKWLPGGPGLLVVQLCHEGVAHFGWIHCTVLL